MDDVDIVNHLSGDCTWYHSTPGERLDKILKEGLKINSPPSWYSRPQPFIYVSVRPTDYVPEGYAVLAVDLVGVKHSDAGWPCGREDPDWEDRWQLRVFTDIPPNKIRRLPPFDSCSTL